MPSSKTPMIAHISLVRVCRWLRKTEEEPCLPKRRPEPRVPAYAVVGGDRALGGTRRARDSWIGGHSRTPRGLPSRSSWFPRKCHGSLEAEGSLEVFPGRRGGPVHAARGRGSAELRPQPPGSLLRVGSLRQCPLPVPGSLLPCDEMSGTGETLLLRRGHRARSPCPAAVPQLWMSLQTPVPGPPGRRLMQCGAFSLSSNTADARFLPNVIARRAVARVWAPTLELSLQGLHRWAVALPLGTGGSPALRALHKGIGRTQHDHTAGGLGPVEGLKTPRASCLTRTLF